jgi:S-adenosylmethionine synthetase
MKDYLFTSESVSEGHPDKVCDRISDAIVDLYLSRDPYARVAVESLAASGRLVIAGEVRGPEISADELRECARQQIKHIGYASDRFHWQHTPVDVWLNRQSPDIAQGVDASTTKDEGAGDQGIMFGFACDETDAFMPAPIYYAHKILRLIFEAIHQGILTDIGPDAKSQVTIRYVNGRPVGTTSVVVSIQHRPHLSQADVREAIRPYVLNALPEGWMCPEAEFYVNPTGLFTIGGPESDTGLTGRKIIVDSYGGAAPHGGGAFSGKDPTKVDRSAAYAARYLAKNVVASGLARKCTLQIAYAIGIAKPLSFYVNLHGTGQAPEAELALILQELVDLSPRAIRERLQLNRPIYLKTSSYGHFGRDPEPDGSFSWEKTDLVAELRRRF